jgi:hypothetical protein
VRLCVGFCVATNAYAATMHDLQIICTDLRTFLFLMPYEYRNPSVSSRGGAVLEPADGALRVEFSGLPIPPAQIRPAATALGLG